MASCELVKIGSGNSGIINPTQENAIGAVYLFKAELDSGNLIGASELLIQKNGKQMIKRADGSTSQRGLWDNIRAAKGSGKKPTAAMLKQEKKIKAKTKK